MKRLTATLAKDARLQYRSGFHAAVACMAVLWMLGLSRVSDAALDRLLPVFILANLLINTFCFAVWQVLVERAEGTFSMVDVTPLRPHEYLASKAGTLVFLSSLGNTAVILSARGPQFQVLPLLAGMAAAGTLFTLAGFILASRYASLKGFLMPSLLLILVMAPPFFPSFFGLTGSPWFYLHPLQAPLCLLQGAFREMPRWEACYAAGYSLIWIGAALVLGKKAFAHMRTASAGSG